MSSRLHTQLQIAAIVANAAAFIVLALLAPGVLLLEPGVSTAALVESAWTYPIVLGLGALATMLRMARLGPTLRSLEAGEADASGVDAGLVRRLHALPLSWTIQLALQAVAVAALTIIPALRPSLIDGDTQGALVLLTATVTAATSLPLYVVARAMIGQTMENIPWRTVEAAMREVDANDTGPFERTRRGSLGMFAPLGPDRLGRVRGRMVNAVTMPVAIIVCGALLLVNSHVRAFETRHRRDDAYALARGVLEPEGRTGAAGRDAAIRAAEGLGYQVELAPPPQEDGDTLAGQGATAGEGGVRTLRTRLEDMIAIVRFHPTSGTSPIEIYVVGVLVAIGLATLVGRSIAAAVSTDLVSATREVRLLGTRDVLRGATRVAGPARFDEVAALGLGVEEVAERFREFAQGRERMIEARESAQRMRDLFLASMSHDLRSPLNGILGFVALLQKLELTNSQRESLAIIDRRGRELLELIENILDAAKIEAGRLELARDWVAPAEILSAAVRRGRELAEEKATSQGGGPVEVRGELQSGMAPLWVDGPRLTQAVINLVANAVKFVDRGVVRVRIASSTRGKSPALKIEVEDQGRGIPEKDLAQIFDAFRQPIRSRRHGGLGLGLTMTRALVELHGGSIDVASSPETGSVFTLSIPLTAPAEGLEAGGIPSQRGLFRMPTPAAGVRAAFDIVPEPPASKQDHEDPTVQMPALEIAPDSGDVLDGTTHKLPAMPRPAAGSPSSRKIPLDKPLHPSAPPVLAPRTAPAKPKPPPR